MFLVISCAKMPTAEEASTALSTLRGYEDWAWAAGMALIWADVMLPVPQTAVIAGLGIIYGSLLGGVIGSVGLITGGLLGYGLMFTFARRFARRLVRPRAMQMVEALFRRGGTWAILLTRSLPYSIPEATVFLAGISGMPLRVFLAALTIGCIPTAFVFAAIGAGWADRPVLALVVSYVVPIPLLLLVLLFLRRRAGRG